MEVIMEGEKYVVEINGIFMCTLRKYFDGIYSELRVCRVSTKVEGRKFMRHY